MKRVLLVDDEEDLTWSIAKHLEKDKDRYQLFVANHGREALNILSQVPIDLVVSDIRMPEISGLDLLMDIREKFPSTKVIIMTAYGSSEVQKEANERGCFKYIEKPFEIQKLREFILSAVEDKKGFEGKVSDFQLSDLIQMNCLGRLTNALHVEKGLQRGTIFIEDGNITHCEMGELEGEEAFYEIMSWEGGTFSIDRGTKSKKETILKGWQGLLMESMRLVDEKRKKGEGDALLRNELEAVLNEYNKNKGVVFSAVLDSSGATMAESIHPLYKDSSKASKLLPVINALTEFELENIRNLGLKNMKNVFVEFQEALSAFYRFPGRQEWMVVVAKEDVNVGLIRMEIKKVSKKITRILDKY